MAPAPAPHAQTSAMRGAEVRAIPGKGLGAVALTALDPGDVVLTESTPVALAVEMGQLRGRCVGCGLPALSLGGRVRRRPCSASCGASWCGERCKDADAPAHAASAECAFLRVINRDASEKGDGTDGSPPRGEVASWIALADEVRLVLRARLMMTRVTEGRTHRREGVGGIDGVPMFPLAALDVDRRTSGRPGRGWRGAARDTNHTLRRIAAVAAAVWTAHGSRPGGLEGGATEEPDEEEEDGCPSSWWLATRTVFGNAFDVAAWEMRAHPPSARLSARHGRPIGGGLSPGASGVPREVRVGGAVYGSLSRFNHSCAPNCKWSFVPATDTSSSTGVGAAAVDVRVIRPVRAGDELTLSYLDASLPRRRRRAALWAKYRFECDCERCAEEGGDFRFGVNAPSDWFRGAAGACRACGGWMRQTEPTDAGDEDASDGVEKLDDVVFDDDVELMWQCLMGCDASDGDGAGGVAAQNAVEETSSVVHAVRETLEKGANGLRAVAAAATTLQTHLRRITSACTDTGGPDRPSVVHPFHATCLEAYELLAAALSVMAKAGMGAAAAKEEVKRAGATEVRATGSPQRTDDGGERVCRTGAPSAAAAPTALDLLTSAVGYALLRAAAAEETAVREPAAADAAARAWMEVSERVLWCAQTAATSVATSAPGGGDAEAAPQPRAPTGRDVAVAWQAAAEADPLLSSLASHLPSWVFGDGCENLNPGDGMAGEGVWQRASEAALFRAVQLCPDLAAHFAVLTEEGIATT